MHWHALLTTAVISKDRIRRNGGVQLVITQFGEAGFMHHVTQSYAASTLLVHSYVGTDRQQ